jgi:type II pantothenate kinase
MRESEAVAGLDVGATLAKIALSRDGEEPHFELLSSARPETVAEHVAALGPRLVGVTGGGGAKLAGLLEVPCESASEIDAWGAGAMRLLERTPDRPPEDAHFLLVSLGTGTSITFVRDGRSNRVGGTGVGGGAVVGLGGALTGVGFEKLCALAERGDSRAVDLLVSDIYGKDEFPLAGDLTAANFGKLARRFSGGLLAPEPDEQDRANLAASVMRLVGETVALVCGGLSAATGAKHVVFGGSTLRGNRRLVEVLGEVTRLCGLQACFLPHGCFAGALGALELARRSRGAAVSRGL